MEDKILEEGANRCGKSVNTFTFSLPLIPQGSKTSPMVINSGSDDSIFATEAKWLRRNFAPSALRDKQAFTGGCFRESQG